MPRISFEQGRSAATYLRDDFTANFRSRNSVGPDPIEVEVSPSLHSALVLETSQRTALLSVDNATIHFLSMPVRVVRDGPDGMWYHRWVQDRQAGQVRPLSPAQQQELRRLWTVGTATARAPAQPIDETVVEVDFD